MELLLIVALALILLGPKDMAKTGKTIGKWLNDLVKSDAWQVIRETSKTIRTLPTQLMRDANFEEELEKGLNSKSKLPGHEDAEAWPNSPQPYQPDPLVTTPEENSIQPSRSQPYAPGKPVIASSKPVKKITKKSTTKAPGKTKAANKSGKPAKASSTPAIKRGNKDNA